MGGQDDHEVHLEVRGRKQTHQVLGWDALPVWVFQLQIRTYTFTTTIVYIPSVLAPFCLITRPFVVWLVTAGDDGECVVVVDWSDGG